MRSSQHSQNSEWSARSCLSHPSESRSASDSELMPSPSSAAERWGEFEPLLHSGLQLQTSCRVLTNSCMVNSASNCIRLHE